MSQGERIKKARADKGLTQDEVAKALKTTKQTIYKYESDIITNIPVDRVTALSKLLGVSVIYIILGTDIPSEKQKAASDLSERLRLFSMLSPEAQAMALDYIRYLAEKEGHE